MMETLITAIQSLCGAGLVLGIALSLYQGARPRDEAKGFDYATANDFETGHRRWGRSRYSR
ncbi:MAG TPA: hypothetical protein VMS53_07265 [Burkholderiales bacterium]|nr:hypothetical protein [Burkholderiales bacterium]